jgi:hypothetical protein
MTGKIERRTVLLGGGAAVAAAIGGLAAVRLLPGPGPADADAEGFVSLLAEVHDDYVNGRVAEHDGWVLSQHELDTIGSRVRHLPSSAAVVG